MQLSFFGGTKIVSGVNYLLESPGKKILVDCGFFFGKDLKEKNLEPFPYLPKEIDALILSHAHFDHCGLVPKLIKEGFKGKIFATPATFDLLKIIFEDFLNLEKNPPFSKKEIKKIFELARPIEYHKKIQISKEIKINFLDAGHILGSAITEIFTKNKKGKSKIVFSGDLGNFPTPLLRAPEFPEGGDFVIVESTHGDRIYEDFLKRRDILEDIIEEIIKNKGVLLIPAFAIERTQEILYELNQLIENRRFPLIPVFVDSPMAKKITLVYKRYKRYYGKEASFLLKSGDDIFRFPKLKFVKTFEDSKKIEKVPPPKIIIAGSGFSESGRILFYEKKYLPFSKNCILFIAHQIKGTRGKEIQEEAREIEILGKKIPVRAKVKTIESYSAHPDQENLFRWVYHIKSSQLFKKNSLIKKVFITQGEEKAAHSLSQLIKDKLGLETEVPEYGSKYNLDLF